MRKDVKSHLTKNVKSQPEQITAQIKSTYTAAKKLNSGASFDGYCGKYVRLQLTALGIISSSDTDVRGNGNQMYNNTKAGQTSTGYTKTKYSGNNCLYNIKSANGGGNVYNILISWTYQCGPSTEVKGPFFDCLTAGTRLAVVFLGF